MFSSVSIHAGRGREGLNASLNSPLLQGKPYKARVLDAESKQDPSLSSLVVEGNSGLGDAVPMA